MFGLSAKHRALATTCNFFYKVHFPRRLVRRDSGGGTVHGSVGRNQSADDSADRTTNRHASQRANPAPTLAEGGCADARSDESADNKADHGVPSAPGIGGCRDAGNILAFHGYLGAPFVQREGLISHADKFPVMSRAGLDYHNFLACLKAIQVGPRTLLRIQRGRKHEGKNQNQYRFSHGASCMVGAGVLEVNFDLRAKPYARNTSLSTSD